MLKNLAFMSLFFTAFLMIFGLQSCSEKKAEPAKSMEQIQKEDGVPVKITEVKYQELSLDLKYLSTLEGYRQSTVVSMVGDKVEKFDAKVGTAVKEGQIVVEFPLNNPALQFEQAKIGLENAKKIYDRMKALLEGGETSQQNYDNVETQYLVAKRNFESLKQLLFIEAPISGLIVEKFIEEGQKVKIGDKLFTVAQIDKMKAVFWVSDEEMQYFKNGMSVTITKNDKVFNGRITEVALAQDMMKKAYKIVAEFPNSGRNLLVGMTVELTMNYYNNPKAVVIPRSAVVYKVNQAFVFVVNGETAKLIEVKLGKSQGEMVEIYSGLNIGDKLIYQGVSLLNDGAKLLIEH